MTKVELEDFVREVYASFNQTFYEADRDYILRAWWNLLRDLDVKQVRQRFTRMAVVAKFMPTPGMIRRAVVEGNLDIMPPSPQEAWAQLQRLIQGMNSGTHSSSGEMHPVLGSTLQALGSMAFGLSTNGDREFFMGIYSERLANFLADVYKVEE
jgi:hypothetical protein